jgi:hypothetical protein
MEEGGPVLDDGSADVKEFFATAAFMEDIARNKSPSIPAGRATRSVGLQN